MTSSSYQQPSSSMFIFGLRRPNLLFVAVVMVFSSWFGLPAVVQAASVASSDNNFVEYYTLEEQPANSPVGNLIRDFGLDQMYNQRILDELRFTFLTQPAANVERPYFVIDERTGDISVSANRLDREKICPRHNDCVVKFDVAVQPIEYFQIIKVKVEIVDINDNPPTFPERKITHEISELAEPGTAFVVPAASDLDSGRNAVYRYDVLPRDGKFELTSRATADGGTDLRLVLRDRLDREIEDRYLVTVLAIDGGNPPQTGSILVNVTVLDANDNNPQFDNSTYEVWVSENVPVGHTIIRLKARDRDTGQNAAIVYEFTKHTAEEYGHLFGIKSETGRIYIKNNLDFETGSVYLLSVTASDRGPDSLPAHASVIVRVEDVNDHEPQISINTLTNSGVAEVRENSEIGTFVAHLSVVDADSGENGRCLCAVDDRHFSLEQLYPTELKLITAAVLDRERRDTYDLTISCRDFGTIPLTSVVPLRVKVADDNDHSPLFGSAVYENRVEENNPAGIRLFHASASDPDAGPNGQVVYRIDTESARLFSVDPSTGEVSAAVSFDRESVGDQLTVRLTAEDRGDPSRSATVQLRLTIIDIDDSGPVFQYQSTGGGTNHHGGGAIEAGYFMRVAENQPSGTAVGSVMAVDPDQAPYNRFSYSLDRRYDAFEMFDIDPNSGMIVTKEVLNRERQDKYHLVVIAQPDSGTAPSGTAEVKIEVSDVNDKSPTFLWPSPNNETITISSRTPRGHVIARLRAADDDSGINANLTYFLVLSEGGGGGISTATGNGVIVVPRRSPFVVVPDTGSVLVADDLSSITKETFVMRATVRDGGYPSLFDHAFLRIVVSKDVAFVASSSLTDHPPGSTSLGGAVDHLGLLASEDMVVVLAFTLAVIIVAIVIIIVVIMALKRRTAFEASAVLVGGGSGGSGTGRRRLTGRGNGWGPSTTNGNASGRGRGRSDAEEKMQLSASVNYDDGRSCSNGTLAYCNNGKTSLTSTSTAAIDYNGLLAGTISTARSNKVTMTNGGGKFNGTGNGSCGRAAAAAAETDLLTGCNGASKATAVVNAYVSTTDPMSAIAGVTGSLYPASEDDEFKDKATCGSDRHVFQTNDFVTSNPLSSTISNNNAGELLLFGDGPYGGRGLDGGRSSAIEQQRNGVKSSATAADLNRVTMPAAFKSSWQSLTLQNDQPKRPVVVFIRDQAELSINAPPTSANDSDLFGPSVSSTAARFNDGTLPPHQRIGGPAGGGLIDPGFVRQMSSYGTLPLPMTSLGHHRRHRSNGRNVPNAAAVVSDDDVGDFDGSFRHPASASVVDPVTPTAPGYHHHILIPSMNACANTLTGGPIKSPANGQSMCNGTLPAGMVANGNGVVR